MAVPLSFSPAERPNLEHATSQLFDDISRFRKRYQEVTAALAAGHAREFIEEFARAMTVDYIYHLNIGEMVGTQTLEDTETALQSALMKSRATEAETGNDGSVENCKPITREERESVNTYRAMAALRGLRSEMKNTGILTVQQICDVHKVLMDGLHPDAGKLRQVEVFTHTEEGIHVYPNPQHSESLLYSLIDHHNLCIQNCPTNGDIGYIFKCAAQLLFSFVDAHPFSDGNGRMCRLLANHVLSLITPFPVGLYHKTHTEKSERRCYIDAIVDCRSNPGKGPGQLAFILVGDAWRGWKSLFENLERTGLGNIIGPIVYKFNSTS